MKLKNELFHRRCRFASQSRHLSLLFVFVCFCSLLNSTTWHIKQDGSGNFTNIQEGINVSTDSDTVLVYPGTYFENLDMSEKNIILASLELTTGNELYITDTIIDGQNQESCIILHDIIIGATIRGFTIQNGFGTFLSANDGGGIQAQSIENSFIVNCHFYNNLAAQGGAIFAVLSDLTLSGLRISHNSASWGGALFVYYNNSISFDPENLCNIYNNNASKGADLFVMDTGVVHVVVDTFSVFNPDRFFAEYDEDSSYTFDIQNNWMELEPNDLYVAVNGDDANSGLSPDEPLKNISWAVRKIQADSLNPRTVHVAAGTYSHEINEQIFPIGCKEYVSIFGEDMETTILYNDFTMRAINGYNLNGATGISNFTIQNDPDDYSDIIMFFWNVTDLNLSNITISNNSNIKRIFYNEFVFNTNDINFTIYDNVNISNNIAIRNAGFELNNTSGIMKNCLFNNNSLIEYPDYPGVSALHLTISDHFTFENTIFSNCSSYDDESYMARIGTDYDENRSIMISNCLFTGNSTNSNRVMSIFYTRDAEFNNCTFSNNTATNSFYSSTIYTRGNINMTNTIMHDNTDYEIFMKDDTPYGYTYELNLDYCNIKNGEDGVYNMNNVNIINWGEGNIEDNPLFLLSGDHPYQLTELSPCIDTGTADTTGLFLPPWDLLHNQRVWDGDGDGTAIIDMGCYEFGAESYVGINHDPLPVTDYQLTNFPNPFNPETKIVFDLPEAGQVKLEIYNIKGQKVKTLLDCYMSPGRSEMLWNSKDDNGKRVSSGVYFYRLQTPKKNITKKMLLLK